MIGAVAGQNGFSPDGKVSGMTTHTTTSQTMVDVLNISGAGYFLGLTTINWGSATPYLNLIIDGVNKSGAAINGHTIIGPIRFNTSLQIQHRLDASSSTCRTAITYLLD